MLPCETFSIVARRPAWRNFRGYFILSDQS
jgi:hypothetical protein